MSHADTISAALRERVAGIATSVGTAGRSFTRAVQGVARGADIMDVMRSAVDAAVAAKALHAAADAALKDTRAALAEAMESSGCTSLATEHDSAHLRRKPAFLNISDRALIPPEYYVQPPPKLDESAVMSAIKDGILVPGASIGIPNAMTLAISPQKETTP
jgi:hypothetical protein